MPLKQEIFSELEGFVIYEPLLMNEYIKRYNIGDNLLSDLTTSEHGDIVTQSGIMVPIIGIPADYYKFDIIEEFPSNYLKKSSGWILRVENERINIVGIGYLANVSEITMENSLTFSVSNGWYELSIVSYLDHFDESKKCFGLNLKKAIHKPNYSGDIATDYLFENT